MLMTEQQAYKRLQHGALIAQERGRHSMELGPSRLDIVRLNKVMCEYRWGSVVVSAHNAMLAIRTYGRNEDR